VEPRNYQILQEWVNENREGQFAAYAQALSVLRPDQVGYTVQDNFTAVGINGSQGFHRVAMESLKQFWGKRFFSNEYLPFDRPYAGAPEFVQKLHSLGVQIIYLTGRDDSRMRAGTELNFIRDGFPWGSPSTYLWTKPVYNTPDLAHKRAAAERAKDLGTVVASFENEPANLVALKQILPEAMHVFVDTICSDAVASPAEGVFRIQAF
jgi:hypothetical protein